MPQFTGFRSVAGSRLTPDKTPGHGAVFFSAEEFGDIKTMLAQTRERQDDADPGGARVRQVTKTELVGDFLGACLSLSTACLGAGR